MAKKPKMTMKQWEKSPQDAKADASGRHGKEGSAQDNAADARAVADANRRKPGGAAKAMGGQKLGVHDHAGFRPRKTYA